MWHPLFKKGNQTVLLLTVIGTMSWTGSAHGEEDWASRIEVLEQKWDQAAFVHIDRRGMTIRSQDNLYRMRLGGYIQADARFFAAGDSAGTDQFVIRRGRIIVAGQAGEWVEYLIMPEFGGSSPSLQDAYVNIPFHPALNVRMGRYKSPVSLEWLKSGTNLRFAERAYPSSLSPNRDLGAMVHGGVLDGRLNYAMGIFNGTPDGRGMNGDVDDKKDFIGRVFAHPFKHSDMKLLKGLGIGFAGTYGQRESDLSYTQLAGVRSPGRNIFFDYLSSDELAGTVIADGRLTRIAPQGYYFIGPVGVQGEYIQSRTEVSIGERASELSHEAWSLAAYWLLTGENNSYGRVHPEKPFQPSLGQWGAWEVSFRLSGFRADEASFPYFADPSHSASKADSWAVALNAYLTSNLKLAVTYEQTSFTGGADDGRDRPDEKVIFTRMQVVF